MRPSPTAAPTPATSLPLPKPADFIAEGADEDPILAALVPDVLPTLPGLTKALDDEPARIPFIIRLTEAEKELLDWAAGATRYSRQRIVKSILFPQLKKLRDRHR